ncbi:MAG TPA: ThiF family adenylyltransferase [Beutenbergiaceae bacterium]|nr:ThiF family adenylyltransferase [Beutenbergiaceae bacterium]
MTVLPPLVDPAGPLTEAEFARYSRHVLLPEVGEIGQRRLKAARVLVIGAGGLGAPALQYLAAAGVGTIGVIDDDVVDETNLQRQVIHGTGDIGDHKVDSAIRAMVELNPLIEVTGHRQRLTEQNAPELFSQYDLVLDGTDNFPTRYLTCDAASAVNVPVLWASVLGFDAQVSLFWADPPAGEGVTLRDVFPAPPAPGSVPSCSQAGVVGAMVGQIGSLMAAESVKLIIGAGESLLGRVIVFNQLRTTWSAVPIRPRTASARNQAARVTPAPAPPLPTAPTPAAPGVNYVDEEHADETLSGAALVDVREDDEVSAGMLPGARHIPLALILTERGRDGLDPATPVVLYCAQGPRAERAAQELTSCGFTTYVLSGGYTAWDARLRSNPMEGA